MVLRCLRHDPVLEGRLAVERDRDRRRLLHRGAAPGTDGDCVQRRPLRLAEPARGLAHLALGARTFKTPAVAGATYAAWRVCSAFSWPQSRSPAVPVPRR